MNTTVTVALDPGSYRQLEEAARAAGTTLARHARDLLEDLLEPPPLQSSKTTPELRDNLVDLSSRKKAPPMPEPPRPIKQPPMKLKAAAAPVSKPKLMRGMALLGSDRRSEVAQKAAATRRRRAEEAALQQRACRTSQ